jgi:hypothetical protein
MVLPLSADDALLELPPATIEREWNFARAWVYDALTGGAAGAAVSA